MAVDFFERIDNFMSARLEFSKGVLFFLFNMPTVIIQVIPICLLLSILISFGLMSKNREIIALKSSGISMIYLLKPIFWGGVFCSIMLFFLSETIVPITAPRAEKIWTEDVKKKKIIKTEEKNIWINGGKFIAHIKYYNNNPKKKTIFGVSIYYFNDHFEIIRRLDVKKGVLLERKWNFEDVVEQIFDKSEKGSKVLFYEKKIEDIDLLPDDLNPVSKKSEEMSLVELYDYIKKSEVENYDSTAYRVDFYSKTATMVVCIILCIFGASIGIKGNMREGLPVGIAYGIGMVFLYYIFNSFCQSLGYGYILPPVIAGWAANCVFFFIGLYMLLNAD
jgi:lipopolysaccharide export system permease protein